MKFHIKLGKITEFWIFFKLSGREVSKLPDKSRHPKLKRFPILLGREDNNELTSLPESLEKLSKLKIVR